MNPHFILAAVVENLPAAGPFGICGFIVCVIWGSL